LVTLYGGAAGTPEAARERYASEAAVEEHRNTEYFKSLGRAMGAFMDGRPTVQRFKQVTG
jgi:quinol monooxygenase YgiN